MDVGVLIGVLSVIINACLVVWNVIVSRRSAVAAEEANRLSQERVVLVVIEAFDPSDEKYRIYNEGNVPITLWLRPSKQGDDIWRGQKITIEPHETSPVFEMHYSQWPVTAYIDKAPGEVTLTRPDRPHKGPLIFTL